MKLLGVIAGIGAKMGHGITVLDGGMGRELLRSGAPFKQPEWSALALIEAPEYVERAHDAFINAGADVITTNSYAIVPYHIGEERFWRDGKALADLSGRLARSSAAKASHPVKVAGSLPPVFGSYRPDLYDAQAAPRMISLLVDALSPHVDLWLAETQGSIREVETIRSVLGDDRRPFWVSFTLEDFAEEILPGKPGSRLRSGETVAEAALRAAELGASALLFNCSRAEVMEAAVKAAREALSGKPLADSIGAYANAFVPRPEKKDKGHANQGIGMLRDDLDPSGYLTFARHWVEAGASIIGGCCGIGPEHIAEIRRTLGPQPVAA